MTIYRDYKRKVLSDPEVKAEYDASQLEYDNIQAMIDAGKSKDLTQKESYEITGNHAGRYQQG